MSKEQKEYVEGLRRRIKELEGGESVVRQSSIYTKEFKELVLFVLSLAIPMGWTEAPLMSPSSIWHVGIGIALWLLPIAVGAHLTWKLIWIKGKRILAWLPVLAAVAIYIAIVWVAYTGFYERQLEEVKQSLHGTVFTPPSGNLHETVFKFTNDSSHPINLSMLCRIHKILDQDGRKITDINLTDGYLLGGKLDAYGDAKSGQCLSILGNPASFLFTIHSQCTDVEVYGKLSLENHSSLEEETSFRFVGIYSGNQIVWMPQPRGPLGQGSFCDSLIRQLPPPSR